MAERVSQKDFKDRSRPATITKVDPQNKKVSVKFLQQDGDLVNIDLAYSNVGATYGRLYMPQIGDRVYIDYTHGELPVMIGMKPTNVDYLPYLDPGELCDANSDGSYIHLRNKRRRDASGALVDYDSKAPGTQLEPGGIVLGVRSKQDLQSKAPRWYEHSYLSMFDNGDIALQARYNAKEKGLLFMDGASGYSIWTSGDGRPQSYIEQDPLSHTMTLITDGEMHFHTQGDYKRTIYGNDITDSAAGVQLNLGKDKTSPDPLRGIPADFKQITADTDLNAGDYHIRQSGKFLHIANDRFEIQVGVDPFLASSLAGQGDIYLDNTATTNGKLQVSIKGDVNLAVGGNVNMTVKGDANITTKGNTKITAKECDITSSAKTVVNASEIDLNAKKISLNGGTAKLVTSDDFDAHIHAGVQPGPAVSGSPTKPTIDKKAYL